MQENTLQQSYEIEEYAVNSEELSWRTVYYMGHVEVFSYPF